MAGTDVSGWLADAQPFVQDYGLPGLFLAVLLESMGLPLPGETLIIIASSLSALGELNIYGVAATAFTAAVIGDNLGYLIGRRLGRPFVLRHGSRFGITPDRLETVERIIQKRGPIIVAAARFVVLLRQLNGIAAGTAGMHWPAFLLANAVGAALWVGLWTSLAYHFGQEVTDLPRLWHHLSAAAPYIVGAVVLALLAGWWCYRRRGRGRPARRP